MTTLNAGEGKVEELAKVLFRNGIGELVWSVATDEQREICMRQTRALLAALRTPSEGMVEAMLYSLYGREATDDGDHVEMIHAFTAAIDSLTPKAPDK